MENLFFKLTFTENYNTNNSKRALRNIWKSKGLVQKLSDVGGKKTYGI